MEKDLKNAHMTKSELKNLLKNKGKKIEDILLATVDINKQLTIYEK